MNTTFTPNLHSLNYIEDVVKKSFRQFQLVKTQGFLLPDLIRIEKNNGFNSISGANILLRIRNASNWRNCELLGLRPTETPNFYYAGLSIKGAKSLCVVLYEPKLQTIGIKVAPKFYPLHIPDLTLIVNDIINKF